MDRFRACEDNFEPEIPEEFEKNFLGGVIDESINCFIYPRSGNPQIAGLMNIRFPFILNLLGLDKPNVVAEQIIELTEEYGDYALDVGGRLREFGEIIFSGQKVEEKWSLRNP